MEIIERRSLVPADTGFMELVQRFGYKKPKGRVDTAVMPWGDTIKLIVVKDEASGNSLTLSRIDDDTFECIETVQGGKR